MSDIQKHWVSQALRQAEYLQKLSALMNEYDANFRVDSCECCRAVIEINACGSWTPYHDCSNFGVDECIAATQEAIDHARKMQGD